MKKLFLILFTLPIFCFGKAPSASSDGIPAYAGIAVGILAVISILISVYLYLQLSGFRTKLDRLVFEEKVRKDSDVIKNERQGFLPSIPDKKHKEEVIVVKSDKERSDIVTLSVLERTFDEFNMRLLALEDPKKAKELFGDDNAQDKNTPESVTEIPLRAKVQDDEITATPSEPAEHICYAKLTGVEGGFNEDEFLNHQNGEQIYVLTLKDNEGTFTISDNSNAQKYALSDVTRYLKSGCEYISLPDRTSKIITKTHGTAHKSGNQWLIIDKAVIEFV